MPQDFSPGRADPEDGEFQPRPAKRAPHRRHFPHLTLLPLLLLLFAGQLGAAYWSTSYDFLYDEASHISIARSLLEGKGYGYVGSANADAFRPPLVPALYALEFAFTGPSLLGARLLSALFAIAAALALGLAARKLWGQALFFPTAILAAATPLVWFYATKAMTETVTLFLVSLLLFAYISARQSPSAGSRWLLALAPLLSLLFLAKYPALLFAPALAILILAFHRSWLRRRELWISAAIALAILAPWFAMNLTIYGSPVGAAQTHLASSSGFAASIDAYYLTWGLPVLLLAFAPLAAYGLFSLAKSNRANRELLVAILLLSLLFLAALSALEVKRDRYLLPILPGLLLAGSWGLFRLRQRFPRPAAILFTILIIANLILVPVGLTQYPKSERFAALAAAGPALAQHCAAAPVTTNVYPYAFWFTGQPTTPLEDLSAQTKGCVLIDGTVASYPQLEPLLAQRALLFKQGEIRVYA